MLPLRWNEDATPSGGSPQSVVDEQLLEESDLIVAVFKERRGPSRGTEHEIRHFLKRGREKRVMVFFHRDAARDIDLEDLYHELKDQVFYGQYRTPEDLSEQVQDALFDRAQRSLATEPVQKLRMVLSRKVREWQTLSRIGTEAIEHAFTVLDLMHAALLEFDGRKVGLVLGAAPSGRTACPRDAAHSGFTKTAPHIAAARSRCASSCSRRSIRQDT
jgi:hypothetical protein